MLVRFKEPLPPQILNEKQEYWGNVVAELSEMVVVRDVDAEELEWLLNGYYSPEVCAKLCELHKYTDCVWEMADFWDSVVVVSEQEMRTMGGEWREPETPITIHQAETVLRMNYNYVEPLSDGKWLLCD